MTQPSNERLDAAGMASQPEIEKEYVYLRMGNRQKAYKQDHFLKLDAPDHIIPVSFVECAINQFRYDYGLEWIGQLRDVLNSDWNFRMIGAEQNRKWGQSIARLNRNYLEGRDPNDISAADADYLLRMFDHFNKNRSVFEAFRALMKGAKMYFTHFSKIIPYCDNATRHW